jgi:hypothetical protein
VASGCRGALSAAVIFASVLAGCDAAEPLGGGSEAASPAVPAADIAEARTTLGDPLVALTEAALVLADDMEAARFELARGRPVLEGLATVRDDIETVEERAEAAQRAAVDAPVRDAARIVANAASTALEAAASGGRETGYVRRLALVDVALLEAAARWDEPGSQSEQRQRLSDLAAEVEALPQSMHGMAPQPQACRVSVVNRLRWIDVVAERSRRLAELATGGGGEQYDQLRTAFRIQPLAEDPLAADAAERQCWLSNSPVPASTMSLRSAVDELSRLLA